MMSHAATDTTDLALPAQIVREGGGARSVTIAKLSQSGCLIREQLPVESSEEAMQLWVGAIGPLRVRQSARSNSEIEFDGPINPAIVAHFNT